MHSDLVLLGVLDNNKKSRCLEWSVSISWLLKLNFESLHPNLKPIHSLYGCMSTCWIVETDKSKTFALVCSAVNEDLRTDDIAKGEKHLHKLCISKLLRKVVDEQVATIRSAYGATNARNGEAGE